MSDNQDKDRQKKAYSLILNSSLILGSLIFGVLIGELVFRLISNVSLAEFRNWRDSRVTKLGAFVDYDPLIGWSMKEFLSAPEIMLTTTQYGIRLNAEGKYDVPQGSILAVGDSFTAGSETYDAGTWPAHLEQMLGQRVLNAGVGGYGVDQIVLRAERLIPILNPRSLIVGLLDQDILRVAYSRYGAEKPFYTLGPDGLKLNNVPVPRPQILTDTSASVKTILGYSYLLDFVLSNYAGTWYSPKNSNPYKQVNTDEVEISCALLARLKKLLDGRDMPGFLVMQYGGALISAGRPRPSFAVHVMKCAARFGYYVIDEYDELRKVALRDLTEFKSLYVMGPAGVYGHMSSEGNRLVAEMISSAIHENSEPRITGVTYTIAAPPAGDGINRVSGSEKLDLSDVAAASRFERVTSSMSQRAVYRLASTKEMGEHYVRLFPPLPESGPFTLSIEVRSHGKGKHVRLQLLDSRQNGALADADLTKGAVMVTRLGSAEYLRADIEQVGEGWYKLWVGGVLPADGVIGILQLLDDNGSSVFSDDVHMEFRAVQLEGGVGPTAYSPNL